MWVRADDGKICIRVTVERETDGFARLKAVLTMKLKICLPGWDAVLTGKLVTDVSEGYSAFIFRATQCYKITP
jgi:hypothetical protein